MIKFDWSYVIDFFPKILQALPVTLFVVLIAAISGLILGTFIAIIRIEKFPVLKQLCALFISFTRGTPIFIQMFVIYYGLPMILLLFGINIMRASKMAFVLIAYGLNAAAFFSEIVRSAILSVPRAQWDAAFAIGHNKAHTYMRIVLPQSVIIAIPSVGNQLTGLLQDTSLTFAMGIVDVIGMARSVGNHDMHTLEAFVDAAIIFIVLSIGIQKAFAFIEKKTRTQRVV
ncbi:MAG: amino acid ABC transporter permease [Spirochaetaceae bacterium]|jgi:L-cystine transport system permease protein|nr:amino acid ABC transporter permease [Spirochaetaceae bacterium]